jgi:hypothetical protein
MSGIAVRDVPQGILGLHSLPGGDARMLNLVARAFYRSVQMDLACLEEPQDGDWARRIAMVARKSRNILLRWRWPGQLARAAPTLCALNTTAIART